MKNRYANLLNSVPVTDATFCKRYIDPERITNPRISRLNANAAGLFTDLDIIDLENRIGREKKAKEQNERRPVKGFNRITIRNASKEQVQSALHKVHFKSRKG